MTRDEYEHYERTVARFFEHEGVNCLTADGEPEFSWRSCECCGTELGGDRYEARAYHPATNQVLEYEVCADCVYYAEYGQLDDATMLEIEL